MILKYLVKYPKERENEIFLNLKTKKEMVKKTLPFKVRLLFSFLGLSKYLEDFDFKYYKQKEDLVVEFSGKALEITPELFKGFIRDILVQYFKNIDERIEVSLIKY